MPFCSWIGAGPTNGKEAGRKSELFQSAARKWPCRCLATGGMDSSLAGLGAARGWRRSGRFIAPACATMLIVAAGSRFPEANPPDGNFDAPVDREATVVARPRCAFCEIAVFFTACKGRRNRRASHRLGAPNPSLARAIGGMHWPCEGTPLCGLATAHPARAKRSQSHHVVACVPCGATPCR